MEPPKMFIAAGIMLVLIGISWRMMPNLRPFNLPGDIALENENFSFYFPITTSIVLSILFTLILWILRRMD